MSESTDRNKFKKLFANNTSRILLGAWLLLKGARFPVSAVAELLSMPEDATLDAKLQTFSGLGLVHITREPDGRHHLDFLPSPNPEVEATLRELFEARKHDFEDVEAKVRSLVYKSLLTAPL